MTILEMSSKFYTTEVSIFNRDGGLIISPVSRVSGVQVRLLMQVQ
jgi:virulence-associated protein VagC